LSIDHQRAGVFFIPRLSSIPITTLCSIKLGEGATDNFATRSRGGCESGGPESDTAVRVKRRRPAQFPTASETSYALYEAGAFK